MLLPDGKMGVIDFGAVAPLPGGIPVELGHVVRYAVERNYDELLPAMEKLGLESRAGIVAYSGSSTRCRNR